MELTVRLPKLHPKQDEFVRSIASRVVVRAGRRGGKTIGMGVLAVKEFLSGKRVLYGAPTSQQVDRFWATISAALTDPIKAGIFKKNETEHIVELVGAEQRIRAKTCWSPDTLRGDYADVLILDEWQMMSEETWGLVGAPMLLDRNGRAFFIYTPPSLRSRSVSKARDPQHAAKLFKKAQALSEKDPGRWATFHFSSMDNPHISAEALNEITGDMTNLAYRMEILAEDINEVPGALWSRKLLDDTRVLKAPSMMSRVVVGVDPSISSHGNEAGIVVAGCVNASGHGYVFEDCSMQGSPLAWAQRAVEAYHRFNADVICAEQNQGGEMVELTIKQADPSVNVKRITSSKGKVARAEPVAAKYEKGLVHHVGTFPHMEDEMCLAGGTLIATLGGAKPIENITTKDFVLTRRGLKRVRWAGQTGVAHEAIKITTFNGRQLMATANHPVFSKGIGFVRAEGLKEKDELEVSLWRMPRLMSIFMGNRSFIMGKGGLSQKTDIAKTGKAPSCIGRYGKSILEKFQLAFSFITRTATGLIFPSTTLSFALSSGMPSTIPATDGPAKRNRTFLKLAKIGGKTKSHTRLFASLAAKSMNLCLIAGFIARRGAGTDTIAKVEAMSLKIPVYNIQVENVHEYFANGILVHNCLYMPGDDSPNRLDALVMALTDLMTTHKKVVRVI